MYCQPDEEHYVEIVTPLGRMNFSDENAKYIPEEFFRLIKKEGVEA
jgi:hypothetical protein